MLQPAAEPRYAVYHARDHWAMLFPHADRWLDHQALHFRHVGLTRSSRSPTTRRKRAGRATQKSCGMPVTLRSAPLRSEM